MVHNNNRMDKGTKMLNLKARIKGSASKIINHLDPTPENYDSCYELIRKRSENKCELLSGWIEKHARHCV